MAVKVYHLVLSVGLLLLKSYKLKKFQNTKRASRLLLASQLLHQSAADLREGGWWEESQCALWHQVVY